MQHASKISKLVILAVLVSGCGANLKEKAIRSSFQAVRATQAGFLAYVKAKGKQIVESAKTNEEKRSALDALYEKVEPIHLAIQAAYSALAVAALEPTLDNLNSALTAAKRLYQLYESIGGDGP